MPFAHQSTQPTSSAPYRGRGATTGSELNRRVLSCLALAGSGAGLLACSGLNGVEVETADTTLAFSSSTFSGLEGGAPTPFSVTLLTELPETTAPVTVTVTDLGTGTATPGFDYAAFNPVIVTFPAGSRNGETQVLDVTTSLDTLAEGADETIRFGLSNASNAAILGVPQTSVVIQDASSASVAFTSDTTVTPDESSSNYNVTAALSLSPGATLGFDIDLRFEDDGTADATSGADYATIAPEAISFPAGTASGATATVTLQVIDDANAEGLEFFAVRIAGTSLDQLDRDGVMRHVVNITDDEAAAGPAMTVTSGPTGSETTHTGTGETMDLGAAISSAGPGFPMALVVSNMGSQSMQLAQPVLSGGDETDFIIEVESASLESGARSAAGLTPPSEVVDLGAPFLRAQASSPEGPTTAALGDGLPGIALTVDEAALADLSHVDRVRLHGFPLPGGLGEVTLELSRVHLPIAKDAVLMVDGEAVAGGPLGLVSDLSTWSGHAVEIPGSHAFIAFSTQTGPTGYLKLPYGERGTIHLSAESPATSGAPAMARLVHEADLAELPASDRADLCGGEVAPPGHQFARDLSLLGLAPMDGAGPMSLGSPPTSSNVTVANCRMAIETDFQFYGKFNSSSELTDYVTSLVAAVSDQYFEDVQTTLSIAYLGIHTTSNDGWTTPDGPGNTADMLNEFRGAWTGTGSWPVSADLAHFLSGASLGGGRAYLDVLCNQQYGFGVSGNLRGNINWQTWTGNAGSFTWDFVVFAHEVGHNFGASHTHDYCPPIDSCYDDGGCVNGTQCTQGTIMSYCHACGGMDNIDLHFDTRIADIMRGRVNASCLGDALMQPGDNIRYRLRFDPRDGTGVRTTTLRLDHDAPNAPDPFEITLTGTAN